MRKLGLGLCLLFAGIIHAQTLKQVLGNEIKIHASAIRSEENRESFVQTFSFGKENEFNGKVFLLIQFYATPNSTVRESLSAKGLEFYDYLPNKAYYVGFNSKSLSLLSDDSRIRFISLIKPEWKISPLISKKIESGEFKSSQIIHVITSVFENLHMQKIQNILTENGFTFSMSKLNKFEISLPLSRLNELAALPFISHVADERGPTKPENLKGRNDHRSNMIGSDFANGLPYNGTGVKVAMGDDGKIGPHIDHTGRKTELAFFDNGTHGDHVAGTIFGAGNLDPTARGMAWGASLYVYDVWDNIDDANSLYVSPGIRITSTSYSNGCNAGYTDYARTADIQIRQNNSLMHVFSAGNEGDSDCDYGAGNTWGNVTGGIKVAKNLICVGNLNYKDVLEASSSRGPSKDGRIKPEVCAVGKDVYSTMPDNTYDYKTGTSMSCPAVSGIFAQLYQAYKENNAGIDPPSALIKAIVMNSADDLGNAGPDFKTGFGRVNAFKAYKAIAGTNYYNGTVDQSGNSSFTLNVPADVLKMKVMLYWHDREAVADADVALINNLDFTMTDPTTTVHFPYILNIFPSSDSLNKPATRGRDTLNNMEQIALDNPSIGTYTLNVEGFNVPFGPQTFYITYEFLYDSIKIVYPNTSENLAYGFTETIRWDATGDTSTFNIRYSIDGGTVWNNIATNVSGNTRFYDWNVPTITSGRVKIAIGRGSVADTSGEFSVTGIPNNFKIDWDCGDSLQLVWNPVYASTHYEISKLGNKYMDSIGTTVDTFFVVHGLDSANTDWFSVRARGDNLLVGRRAWAIEKIPGAENCITAIEQKQNISNWKVYPNPNEGRFTFVGANNTLYAITLYDILGRALVSFPNILEQYTFDVREFPSGIYFLNVISAQGSESIKMIKN